jgi:VIT1/CCC1 family predicted Fe2+/Mn2+ transporter
MPKFEDRELVRRWRSESPRLFKTITNVMVSIGVVSGIIVTLPISLPATIVTIATYGVVIGTTGATISKLTKK